MLSLYLSTDRLAEAALPTVILPSYAGNTDTWNLSLSLKECPIPVEGYGGRTMALDELSTIESGLLPQRQSGAVECRARHHGGAQLLCVVSRTSSAPWRFAPTWIVMGRARR